MRMSEEKIPMPKNAIAEADIRKRRKECRRKKDGAGALEPTTARVGHGVAYMCAI
jgi:hypothetical protein